MTTSILLNDSATRRAHGRLAGFLTGWLIASFGFALAQTVPPDALYSVMARDMNTRTWARKVTTTDPATGVATSATQSYQELGNGISYQPDGPGGAWADSQDLVEITARGAQAVHGPFPAMFADDITSPNPITLFPPAIGSASQTVIQLAPVGLFYFDPTPPGKIAQIGLFQPSRARLHGNNVLVYPDVIPGVADLVVVWTHSGVEDSIVLKKAPPPPGSYGLSEASTVQYWATFNGPQPLEQRPVLLSSGLEDHILIFDGFWMPVGGVFGVGHTPLPAVGQAAQIHLVDPSAPGTLCLAKTLANIDSQTVLIEEVRYADLLAQLKQMGLAAAPRTGGKVVEFAHRGQLLSRPAGPKPDPRPVEVASTPYVVDGVVMDPYTILSGTSSSYTFSAGTYLITNSYSVGAATFQDGACIKFASNAYLLVSGSASFPGSGQVQFSSMDDNSIGTVITNSSSEPSYAAAKELWLYHPGGPQTVANALFRWAQRGLQYETVSCGTGPGGGGGPSVSSCAFQNCATGLYQNMPQCTLSLSSDTYCNVVTPLYTQAGSVSGSITQDCGTPVTNLLVDASQQLGIEGEPAIAVNPTDPQNLFMAANHQSGDNSTRSISWARSLNGGATWSSNTAFASSFSDPSVAFDAFGNLFVCYFYETNVMVQLSTNKGSSFDSTYVVLWGSFDWTRIATGPGSVWVTSYEYSKTNFDSVNSNAVNGAVVTGLGMVGQWTNLAYVPCTGPDSGAGTGYGYGDIAVGPTGQVAVVSQNSGASTTNSQLRVGVNLHGLSESGSFSSVWTNANIKVGYKQRIPAETNRFITPNPGLAWDRTGGQYRGRLYIVYTDRTNTNYVHDTDIYVNHSDDNGSTWTNLVKINTDGTTNSQFFPRIAVDQTSGKVAVSWYDCRADTQSNRKTQFYAAVSSDGGATFSSSNLQLETGQSDVSIINTNYGSGSLDYFDYTGLAFYGGYFYAAWADNSNSTTNNPDGTAGMDVHVSKVRY